MCKKEKGKKEGKGKKMLEKKRIVLKKLQYEVLTDFC
jgi:hypothetical protein